MRLQDQKSSITRAWNPVLENRPVAVIGSQQHKKGTMENLRTTGDGTLGS